MSSLPPCPGLGCSFTNRPATITSSGQGVGVTPSPGDPVMQCLRQVFGITCFVVNLCLYHSVVCLSTRVGIAYTVSPGLCESTRFTFIQRLARSAPTDILCGRRKQHQRIHGLQAFGAEYVRVNVRHLCFIWMRTQPACRSA